MLNQYALSVSSVQILYLHFTILFKCLYKNISRSKSVYQTQLGGSTQWPIDLGPGLDQVLCWTGWAFSSSNLVESKGNLQPNKNLGETLFDFF
jgi:hypothetical protein